LFESNEKIPTFQQNMLINNKQSKEKLSKKQQRLPFENIS
jgi:hypothetical protein